MMGIAGDGQGKIDCLSVENEQWERVLRSNVMFISAISRKYTRLRYQQGDKSNRR